MEFLSDKWYSDSINAISSSAIFLAGNVTIFFGVPTADWLLLDWNGGGLPYHNLYQTIEYI